MEDIATKVEGSILSPEEFNQIPEELENAITSSGQTLTKQDTTQLRKAIAAYAGAGAGFNVTGSANNLVLTPYDDFQAPIRYYPNQVINFIPSSSNTTQVTISIIGLTAVNLLDSKGQALSANKLVPNTPYMAIFNGTNFQLIETGAALDGSNITSDFSMNVIKDKVSNAVIGYSGAGITYYNNVFTVLAGYQALIPTGRTTTNTLSNYNLYVPENSNFTGPTVNGDYVLLIKQDGTLTWITADNYSEQDETKDITSTIQEYYYNLTDNKTYYHDIGATAWTELPFAKSGEFTVTDGAISKLVVREPVRLDKGGDGESIKASFNLFDFKWSDHLQEDASWLRADTFSWQSGDMYKAAYNELVSQYNSGTDSQDQGIVFRSSPKKLRICLAGQESAVSQLYSETGVAWYYILDTANKRFKLPRTKYGFKGVASAVGSYFKGSVPNITSGNARVLAWKNDTEFAWTEGSLQANSTQHGGLQNNAGNWTGSVVAAFDAALQNSAYKNGAAVQSRSTEMYLYFYVGNTILFDETEADIGAITEALNEKIDADRFQVVTSLPATLADDVFYFVVESD